MYSLSFPLIRVGSVRHTAEEQSERTHGRLHVSDTANQRVIRIAHVIHRLQVGGLENGLVNLINRLPADRFEHVIVCLTDYTDFRNRITADVELYAMHKRPGQDFGLYWRLWKLFRKLKPDVVHTRNLATLESQASALLAGVPVRVHGEHGRDVHDLDNTEWKYRMLRKMFRPAIKRYIALSRDLQSYLTEDVGVKEKKVNLICNGVDTECFLPARDRRAPLPVENFAGSQQMVIGTVGRMEPVKDQLTLARAFIRLVGETPGGRDRLRLVMVGDGSLRAQVTRVLDEAGLLSCVWLPGVRDDTPDLLRGLDVFVLPSLGEGISNTILEAMASGLPVVATSVGGNAELVSEGETGWIVPRDDPTALAAALRRYVDAPALRKRHGIAARAMAESRFSIGRMVQDYMELYDDVCAGSGAQV